MKIVVTYIPVLHEGYCRFFMKHNDADLLFILGRNFTNDSRPLVKDIRAMSPDSMALCIRSLNIFRDVYVLDLMSQIDSVLKDTELVVTPMDDTIYPLVKGLFTDCKILVELIFLRWDKTRSLSQNPVIPTETINLDELEKEMMGLALKEAEKSDDWWRQVGAVASYQGNPLVTAYNRHVPHTHALVTLGDPRANFNKGIHIEVSTAIHSEAALISTVAKDLSMSLSLADLFVTTFPCPPCAKLIAYSGIKRLFYVDGYSVLDGQDILESQDIEIIKVEM